MTDTYLVHAGIDASQPAFTRSDRQRRERSALANSTPRKQGDDFAAIKSGLDGTRAQFYGNSGRMPNSRADATRRQRSTSGGSGDRMLTQLDLWTEREISRHLYDHSSIYMGIVDSWAAEVIQCGFPLRPDTGDDDLNILVRNLILGNDELIYPGGWMSECDARGLMHFWDIITLAEETELRDGDHAFYLDPKGNNGRGSVAIIEGDRILTPYGARVQEGFEISNGIVWTTSGYPVSVFIANEAPQFGFCSVENGDFHPIFRPWKPADGGVVLSMDLKRSTSTRRQPWLSTAVRAHDEIDDVFIAVRVALRNHACRSTFTKIDDWEAYREWLTMMDPATAGPAPVGGLTHSPNPGDHAIVNPGETMENLENNAPGDNFEPFLNMQLTTLGLPLGMCLEESVRIFQKSFSASRQAINGTRGRYERRQRRVKRRKVAPLLLFGIACHQKIGLLPNDPRCQRILNGYPGWPYMEPLKDAQATDIMVKGHHASRETLMNEIGYDFQGEIPRMKREDELWPPEEGSGSTNDLVDDGDEE